jgi:hypothetical protein
MVNKLKALSLILFLAVSCTNISTGSDDGGEMIAQEYVSVDCPKGDISLFLEDNGTFVLELKYWDSKENRHTHSEKFSGQWSFKDNELELNGESTLVYKRDKSSFSIGEKTANIDSLFWVSSSSKSFADTFTLVERTEIDNFFRSVIPKQ